MVIFTSICSNYLHKARLLAESVKRNIPDAAFVVCLLERELDSAITASPSFDRVVLAKDTWESGDFDQFIFKHSIVEASTAVKGQFFRYLYKQFPEEQKFVYLDPDTYVYDDFVELRDLLDSHPIVVCPHILQPGNIDMELSSLAHGVFNLGFLAVNRSEEATHFIDWWADRLSLYCYDDKAKGIFTDQKWVALAPCFYDVVIFKHRGYDFATWSLFECGMTEEDGKYFVKGDPLRFIHYSGFGGVLENCIKNWLPEGAHPFKDLYADYKAKHIESDEDNVSKTPWSYGCYFSGTPISNEARIAYREHHYSPHLTINPFDQWDDLFLSAVEKASSADSKVSLLAKAWRVLRHEGLGVFIKKVFAKLRG